VYGGVGDADRAHEAELGLHEKVLQCIFRNEGSGAVEAECPGPMAHGVELEVAEGDLLHLAVGGVILDPVLVAAQTVAGVQHRRIAVGEAGELVEPATREPADARQMGREVGVCRRLEIEADEIAQAAVRLPEVEAGAIGREGRCGRAEARGDVVHAGARSIARRIR